MRREFQHLQRRKGIAQTKIQLKNYLLCEVMEMTQNALILQAEALLLVLTTTMIDLNYIGGTRKRAYHRN
jgi:hypothetical protein